MGIKSGTEIDGFASLLVLAIQEERTERSARGDPDVPELEALQEELLCRFNENKLQASKNAFLLRSLNGARKRKSALLTRLSKLGRQVNRAEQRAASLRRQVQRRKTQVQALDLASGFCEELRAVGCALQQAPSHPQVAEEEEEGSVSGDCLPAMFATLQDACMRSHALQELHSVLDRLCPPAPSPTTHRDTPPPPPEPHSE